ncbi:hypothetical protein [Flammeovirga sp. EKP202]|uniref:hypothetical protein n=1 Tax=Flammeovirga sp. EKP202 TaxID=2770592 RepID=UPI00165EE796|nr:hypothetical protein [Flammeovirga sp. EKP202]MBD0400940.1 hypothetical protein [Flammeovirga sp. EKP202]
MKLKETLYFFLITFFIQACNETITDPNYQSGTVYYPIEEGWYIHYQVDSIDLTSDENSTTSFQLREIMGKPYDDGFGGQNYPLHRYVRDSEEMDWVLDSVWAVVYRDNHIIRYENAIPFLKLTNPLVEGQRFNQNTYNGLGAITPGGVDIRYEIETVGRNYTFDGQTFENTAVILEVNNTNALTNSEETRRAIYQRDIGLIGIDYSNISKRYYEFTTSQPSLAGNPYCGDNRNKQIITLGNGERVDNPFFEQDDCESNPLFGLDSAGVSQWILRWENSANPPIVDWEEGEVITVRMINPSEFDGYREIGTAVRQKIIGYGIDKTVD